LEDGFAAQLEGDFDVHRSGTVAPNAGAHLSAREVFQREKILATIEHKRAAGMDAPQAVADYIRDAAFTTLNRFVALKMLEARELLQECITKGEQSSGYREFCGLAPGLLLLPDTAGYRIYIESLFDELSTEVKVLFDRHDPASVLWPRRSTFEQLLEILNSPHLADIWGEDETIGWVYQFFNSKEERSAMRDPKQGGSQAPRNSRELAVRNQFFTPRYVVQFLTHNTLGRIWYEMRDTKTTLIDQCIYMVRKPGDDFAPRPKKDPRDLRVLDPACGSGHFLLSAFDLLVTIYEEAYTDPDSPASEATAAALAADYPNLDALRRAVPGLILAHNLHGVDIDPRCAQIAQLALWMRAQRAYRDLGLDRIGRPKIRRSNIVIAEPLVADNRIAVDFVGRLGDVELGRVFTGLVDQLKLAGDLGILLRIESVVTHQTKPGQMDLFTPPEDRIRAAVARYILEEDGHASARRRLFAEDAAQGVGLLSMAERKFDVVLMNPPFGAGSTHAKNYFDKAYPYTRNDVYAAFVERGIELLSERGRLGAITSRTGFFLSSFQRWREDLLLQHAPPVVFADLGYGVLDSAMVETAAYCLEACRSGGMPMTTFFRVLESPVENKSSDLIKAIGALHDAGRRDGGFESTVFECNTATFAVVPGTPFAYWVSEDARAIFTRYQRLEGAGREIKQGIATRDDFRFVRAWWEVARGGEELDSKWPLFAKGGAFSPFYSDVTLAVRWDAEAQAAYADRTSNFNVLLTSSKEVFLYRPGLTWPRRTNGLSFRVMPRGCVFADKGPALFVEGDDAADLLALAAVVNSRPFGYLIAVQLARTELAQSYEVGIVQQTPIPDLGRTDLDALAHLARRAWSLKRMLDTPCETSHAFLLPPGQNEKVTGLNRGRVENELSEIQRKIEERILELYGIRPSEHVWLEASLRSVRAASSEGGENGGEEDGDPASYEQLATAPDVPFVSWLVGIAFGRFDPRLVTGERPIPPEPEPFEVLPARSPGMWPEYDRRTALPPDVLVDDPGRDDDMGGRVSSAAAEVGIQDSEDLSYWLAHEFFPLHIKMYSKSRRKAPIYWQLATPSASYSVWLYIHAFTDDTLFRVQNDYVSPKLAHEERKLEAIGRELRDRATAAERKALAVQEVFVEELRTFIDEVKRVAPLWKPDLDDGVIINFAPLWRLVPQHKLWQKELKSTWDALCDGMYDWAHLAMHLWPERVVPKCAVDRSLAVAHGIEEVFWVQGEDGKWRARTLPTRSVVELVLERTSPAVKAALTSLIEAPAANGGSRARGGRQRVARSNVGGGY
jgi:hypothetical protein